MKRSITFYARIWWVSVLGALVASNAVAAGRLNVDLRYPLNEDGRRVDAGKGEVEIVLKNEGDRPVDIPIDGLSSFVNRNGVLLSDLLEVAPVSGEPAAYMGIYIEVDSKAEQNYLRIGPYSENVVKINIALNYMVDEGGIYTVSLRESIPYLSRPRSEYVTATKGEIRALYSEARARSSLRIWFDSRMDIRKLRGATTRIGDRSASCDAQQVSSFGSAKAVATTMSKEAMDHLSSLYTFDVETGFKFTPSARYTKWFGLHGDPNVPNADDDFVDTMVVISYVRIADDQASEKPIMSITCQCTAEDGIDPSKTSAWVTPSVHYVINACPAFWAAPMLPSAKDENSKVGTIVHEATHFFGDWYGGTGHTYPDNYDAAAALAIRSRSQAVRNANNYKFYVLNQIW